MKKPYLAIGIFLTILTLLTGQTLTGVYAKYTTYTTATASARVALFSVSELMNGEALAEATFEAALLPGDSKEQTVEITNDSEVLVRYTVTATNKTEQLPLTVTVSDPADIPMGETATATVTVSWSDTENSTAYVGRVDDIKITVDVVQVD